MKNRDLDEFASLFERSVIPAIEVSEIIIPEIVVLADFSDRVPTCAAMAKELATRFGSRVSARFLLRHEDEQHLAEAEEVLQSIEADERLMIAGDMAEHLMRIVDDESPALIVSPASFRGHGEGAGADGRFIERLLVMTETPVLMVRSPVEGSPFDDIFAQVPDGRHDLITELSFAFALCSPGGRLRLLHVIEEERLEELAKVLEVAPEIDTEAGARELRDAIERRMDHLLKGAIRTAEDARFKVDSAIRAGDTVEITATELGSGKLLILASHGVRGEFLQSHALEIMARIPDIPVLAL